MRISRRQYKIPAGKIADSDLSPTDAELRKTNLDANLAAQNRVAAAREVQSSPV